MPATPLDRIEATLGQMKDALLGTLDGRPGVVQGLQELKAQGERHALEVKAQGERITALEAIPGRRAMDLWERIGILAAGVALTAASQLILTALKSATPTPPAQHGGSTR